MTSDKKLSFQNAVPNILSKFKTIKVLGQGSHTIATLIEYNGKPAVLKRPKGDITNKYIRAQWEHDTNAQISADSALQGFNGEMSYPKMFAHSFGDNNFIIEEYASGEILNSETFQSLSDDVKHTFAQQLAQLLNYMHQKTVTPVPTEYKFASRIDTPEKSGSDQVIELFSQAIPNQANKIKYLFRPQQDSCAVFTHGDIRAANISYDKDNKKFTLIDFGNAKPANKYHDMVIYASAANISMFKTILECANIYNKLEKKHPIYYDTSVIRDLFCRNIIYNFGFFAITHKLSQPELINMWNNDINPLLIQIEKSYKEYTQSQIAQQTNDKGNS